MSGEIVCHQDDSIVTVTLRNPEKRNAIDSTMWRQLTMVFERLTAAEDLRCVIVRGEGEQAFAAGGDIEEFVHCRDTVERAMAYHAQAGAAMQAIADCRHPTIALIHGACIGGGLEVATQCDLRLCGQSARFGAPINRLGFSMYPVELAGLLRLAGRSTMLEMLLEGRILSATEAYARGLVTRVVADDQVTGEAYASARRVADGAPLVARWHKQWLRRLQNERPLTEQELRESFAFLDSEDYREGLAAFLEKRPPQFRGR
ncbi:MAG: enoyl-CoA hydratase/isomerase family protein [Candidatus Accumulibacter sp.]|nr:enoyl-CoA hydratase/isomerase family protein [Accumulibacter sp.]